MRMLPIAAGALSAAICLATPAAAQLRPLVEPPASATAARDVGVEVFLINEGSVDVPAQGPAEIETVARDGTPLRLIAAPDGEGMVRPGGFARIHYRLASAGIAVASAPAPAPAAPAAVAVAPPPAAPATTEAVAVASRGSSNGFVDRFSPHEPVYGAFGLQDAGGKLQVSFAFRAIGREDGPHLNFAYTQNFLWALSEPSGPIGPTTYSPEVFVDVPLSSSLVVGGGYRHDSNGEGPATSIDANRIFARATKSFDLGGDWSLSITPQAWFYVANQGVAPDLDRYWGYTSLSASIGQRDGLKLAGMVRGNPGTGKGAGELFVSYPLTAIGLRGVYLFGQGWTGYGEALSNYNRRDSHARLGIAFTR